MLIAGRSLWLAQTNCYVVAEGRGGPAVVVDAPPGEHDVVGLLEENDLTPVALLLTHGHVDHMGGAGPFQKQTGAAVYVHSSDDYLTLDPQGQLRALFGIVPEGDWAPPVERHDLSSMETLELAGLELGVRHTPGHTPGHCCFYLESAGVLFSGDQLFARSVGRTDLPGGNWEHLLSSMKAKILTLADEVRVLPGHGPETTIGLERRQNPFLVGI